MSGVKIGGGSFREAGALLFRLVRDFEAIENVDCRRCRLTKDQALALLSLKSGSCVSMRQVAGLLGVTAGTATRVLDNLVRDGLARRGTHPSDGRSVCCCPTLKGQERIGLIDKCYEDFWRHVFGGISNSRIAGIISSLKALASSIEDARNGCCGVKRRPERRKQNGRKQGR